MGSVNKAIIVGRVGKDPELKYTRNGYGFTRFTVATNGYRNGGKTTEWHQIVAWNWKPGESGMAEEAAERLQRGSQVGLEGEITYRSWEGDDGRKRWAIEIRASRLMYLDEVPGGQDDGSEAPPEAPDPEDLF